MHYTHLAPGVGLALLLTACTPKPNAAYVPAVVGPWQLQGCSIQARAADVMMITDGRLSDAGQLELRVFFAPNLIRPPAATLLGLSVPVPLEGANRVYTVFLPYNPDVGAQLLQPQTTLRLTYQPLGEVALRDVEFPTASLMEALGRLSCTS